MNILISGASGYLGGNVLSYLSKQKHTISILNRDYEIENEQSEYDIFFYFSNPNEILFNKSPKEATLSMVTHYYDVEEFLDNIRVKSVFYASTVRVHDEKKTTYALTHLFIESLLNKYTTEKNIALSKLRFGNIFGGSIDTMQKRDTLVPHVFIKSALENNKIELLTDGEQYRDFTPIAYVYRYIDYIMTNNPQVIDICTGINFQIIEVVNLIVDEFPDVVVTVNNKHLNETSQKYRPVLDFSKDKIEQEIKLTIQQWRIQRDSNAQ